MRPRVLGGPGRVLVGPGRAPLVRVSPLVSKRCRLKFSTRANIEHIKDNLVIIEKNWMTFRQRDAISITANLRPQHEI